VRRCVLKRIGILGGCSPESTVEYYRTMTRGFTRRFGTHAYPEIVIHSVTFERFILWMRARDWRSLAEGIADGLDVLDRAGAEVGLIASNTFHLVFDEATASTSMQMVSMLDVVADRLGALGCRRAGLLGTKITMDSSFYPERLMRSGIETLVPPVGEREVVDRIVFEDLSRGAVTDEARDVLRAIAGRLVDRGADAIILGCTELPVLMDEGELSVPILDTTTLHANAGLEMALS